MSFIAKNPLIIPKVESTPAAPLPGTRGLFAGNDGWYDIDSDNKTSKLATSEDVDTAIEYANEVASSASTVARSATEKAGNAMNTALDAQATALRAHDNANLANETAMGASTVASSATDIANNAINTAAEALSSATHADRNATLANETANSASTVASSAIEKADNAVELANMSNGKADTAMEKSDNAIQEAQNANTNADRAQNYAEEELNTIKNNLPGVGISSVIASGVASAVSPAYTYIPIVEGISLKKGNVYTITASAETNVADFAVYVNLRKSDGTNLKGLQLQDEHENHTNTIYYCPDDDYDGVYVDMRTGVTSGLSVSASVSVLSANGSIPSCPNTNFFAGDFVNGDAEFWNQGNKVNTVVQYRICCKQEVFYRYKQPICIKAFPGFRFSVGYYEDCVFRSDEGWATEKIIPANQQFRVMITRTTENTSEIADIEEFVNSLIVLSVSHSEMLDKTNDVVNHLILSAPIEPFEVLSINHRGFNQVAPENTIPAFKLSKQNGFDFVECDVRFTSDGVPVLLHDASINRTARNSDGSTISGTVNIADIDLATALTYDFGVYKGSEYAGTKIPTLAEFMKLCRALSLHPYLDVYDCTTEEKAQAICDIIKNCRMENNVTFLSSEYSGLLNLAKIMPEVRYGLVSYSKKPTEDLKPNLFIDKLKDAGVKNIFIDMQYNSCDNALYIALCKEKDVSLEVYCPNTEGAILGLDPFISGVTSDVLVAKEVIASKISRAVKLSDISEKTGTIPDTTNLWTLGDVEFTRQKRLSANIPAGKYTLSVLISSTDTDHAKSLVEFRGGGTVVKSYLAVRNDDTPYTFTLSSDVDTIDFYAANTFVASEGDTATFSNISIIDNNATKDVYTAKDDVARESAKDVEYVQNPNLYDGAWEPGRYVYETGKKYTGDAPSHCRNVNPVPLDPEKGYNLAVKGGYRTSDIVYVYRYDAEMNFLDKYISGKSNSVIHIEGASFVCFHIAEYGKRFPDEPLHVMVWECDNENQSYTEWLEYGEKGSYIKSNLSTNEGNIARAMLSRDKARFDDSFNFIAYSQVNSSGYWINSVEHFKWAAKQPFTALKGDVQPTSDGVLVMCHDDGFSLNDAGQVVSYNASTATPIHSMTSEQCLALLYNGGTQHVCSFDEYVKTCKKYGKIAFITIRNKYMEEVVPALFSVLDKYNMRKRCIINSFTFSSLKAVRNVDNNITLHIVLNSGETISTYAINNAIELGNCMVGGFSFPNSGRFDVFDSAAVEYAKENDIRLYVAMVDSMEDIDLLMDYGVSGAQMLIVPTLD